MAKTKQKTVLEEAKNGLEQAMILLIHNQAAFLTQITAMNARMDERFVQIDERFARIEKELAEIKMILLRHEDILMKHEQILQGLPEAIRQKIGFEPH